MTIHCTPAAFSSRAIFAKGWLVAPVSGLMPLPVSPVKALVAPRNMLSLILSRWPRRSWGQRVHAGGPGKGRRGPGAGAGDEGGRPGGAVVGAGKVAVKGRHDGFFLVRPDARALPRPDARPARVGGPGPADLLEG